MLKFAGAVVLAGVTVGAAAQMVGPKTPPPERGSMRLDVVPQPLLSVASLSFLEGTWTAERGTDAAKMGTYTFARELNGTVLSRRSLGDATCDMKPTAPCARRDLFYVFQDSAGAPLKAIYFDAEGHVIHYDVEIRHEEAAYARRDYAIFSSDLSALGPRFRLSYERSTDTYTHKASLTGKFEILLANGIWHTDAAWGGGLVTEK